MKKFVAVLLCAAMVLACVGCAQQAAPASSASASSGSASSAASAASESTIPASTSAPAKKATEKYAADVEKASTAYSKDKYFDNHEHYKKFGKDGKYKVAFVCKFLTSSWFGPKSAGMKAEADKLGIEYIGIDANNNEDAFMQGVQNAINQDADAIILTPVTAAMLPAVVDLCKKAGVAYITTDDGGYDAQGNRIPHLGLDDYALCYASGKAMGEAAVKRGFDVASLKIALLDAPAVESIHARNLGAYQALMDTIPGLTDDNFLWLDTVDNLTDNNINKLSSAFQANKATTKYWMVYCGGNNVWEAAFPIFDENKVDYKNVICGGVCADTSIADAMKGSADKAASLFCSGILAAPSGAALIDLCNDLFKKGKLFPNFTGYPVNIVSADNIDRWVLDVKASSVKK